MNDEDVMTDDETRAKTDPAPPLRRLYVVSWKTDAHDAVRVVVYAHDHEEALVLASDPEVLGPYNQRIPGLFSEPDVCEWPENVDFAVAFDRGAGDTPYRQHDDVTREIKRRRVR